MICPGAANIGPMYGDVIANVCGDSDGEVAWKVGPRACGVWGDTMAASFPVDDIRCNIFGNPQDDLCRIEPVDLSEAGFPLLTDSIVSLRLIDGLIGEASTTSFVASEFALRNSGIGFDDSDNGFGTSGSCFTTEER